MIESLEYKDDLFFGLAQQNIRLKISRIAVDLIDGWMQFGDIQQIWFYHVPCIRQESRKWLII